MSWHTANDAVPAEGRRLLIDDPARFDGVKVIGADDSPARFAPSGRCPRVWRHTRRGDKCVTVIIDLTPIREGHGPSDVCSQCDATTEGQVRGGVRLPSGPIAGGIPITISGSNLTGTVYAVVAASRRHERSQGDEGKAPLEIGNIRNHHRTPRARDRLGPMSCRKIPHTKYGTYH